MNTHTHTHIYIYTHTHKEVVVSVCRSSPELLCIRELKMRYKRKFMNTGSNFSSASATDRDSAATDALAHL